MRSNYVGNAALGTGLGDALQFKRRYGVVQMNQVIVFDQRWNVGTIKESAILVGQPTSREVDRGRSPAFHQLHTLPELLRRFVRHEGYIDIAVAMQRMRDGLRRVDGATGSKMRWNDDRSQNLHRYFSIHDCGMSGSCHKSPKA